MFGRFITGILASLLTASLFALALSLVFHVTIFNAKYIEGQLTKTNAYNRLSVALSAEVSKQAGIAANPQLSAAVSNVLQPSVLKQKINSTLEAYQAYYEGKGGVPQLDLTDLATQAQAQGIPLPANTDLSQPISLANTNDKGAQNVGKAIAGVRTGTLVLCVVLTLLVAVLSWQTHRYRTLPNVLISAGVFMGLTALVFWLTPGLAKQYIHFINGGNAFVTLGRDLAQSIGHDLAVRFGVLFAVFEIVGVSLRILAGHEESKRKLVPQYGKPTRSVGNVAN